LWGKTKRPAQSPWGSAGGISYIQFLYLKKIVIFVVHKIFILGNGNKSETLD
jgi:hypothetical protein